MIDVKNILDELDIDYKRGGKNVGSNDINIDCPFCGADKHLGIAAGAGYVNCWICEFEDAYYENKSGDMIRPGIVQVLIESTGESWHKIKDILQRNGWEPFDSAGKPSELNLADKCHLPKEAHKFDSGAHSQAALGYLINRGFSEKTIERYKLQIAESGPYSYRLIIPIYFNGELVCYTSRDYTGKQEDRYKNAFFTTSKIRIRDTLYNYDSASRFKHAYMLEGPTDAWRMGFDSFGVFRSNLSRGQRNLIIEARFESLTIIFDPKATGRAYQAASELSPFIPKIKVIRLTGNKDVDKIGRTRIIEMEKKEQLYRG